MSTSKTVMGKPFSYKGSLSNGITIQFEDSKTGWFIPRQIIDIIKTEIAERSPVLMGASRKPLVKDSVGETLYRQHGFSPRAMSYVLPLLVESGYCTVSPRRPFLISAREAKHAPRGDRPRG
jgi:hypothetical protein